MKRALLLVACIALVACRGSSSGECVSTEPGATAIDTETMAFLSAARARHHEADTKESTNDVAGAVTALEQLVAMPRPHAGTRVSEIEEVLADTDARIAELRIRVPDLDGALKAVTDGLTHATDATYFRGHLLEVEGIVEEERAKALDAQGKADDARAARARAVDLFHQSVDIQEKVIDRSLGGVDGGHAVRKRSLGVVALLVVAACGGAAPPPPAASAPASAPVVESQPPPGEQYAAPPAPDAQPGAAGGARALAPPMATGAARAPTSTKRPISSTRR